MINPKIILRLVPEKVTEIKGWFFIKKAKHSLIFAENTVHKNGLDLITIAFNEFNLIKLQSGLIKKFMADKFSYHVVDNSNNEDSSALLFDFCKKNCINYYKLPANPSTSPSTSHGHALNWAIRNIVPESKNIYYGFLDHDIFPIKKISVIRKFKGQAFYGHQQNPRGIIFPWPGFSFFDKRKVNPKELNFLPNTFLKLDTGGRLFKKIKKVSMSEIKWPQHSYIRILNENKTIQENCVEKIDDWIHLMNGCEWKKTNDKKKSWDLFTLKSFRNLDA